MIDEKKIQEAASKYGSENSVAESSLGLQVDIREDTKDAILSGIEWFKQNLWHDEDEVPHEDGSTHLFLLLHYVDIEQDAFGYQVLNLATDFLNFDDFDRKEQWKDFLENAKCSFKWCYLSDLL